METTATDAVGADLTLFKSYYVVWKPLSMLPLLFLFSLFKSYYVVWKLPDFQTLQYAHREFKSYYVVWKLTPVANPTIYGFV